ncbi:MAG: hypothetical protein ACU0BF_06855 [Paracoccaceae bacterium]
MRGSDRAEALRIARLAVYLTVALGAGWTLGYADARSALGAGAGIGAHEATMALYLTLAVIAARFLRPARGD